MSLPRCLSAVLTHKELDICNDCNIIAADLSHNLSKTCMGHGNVKTIRMPILRRRRPRFFVFQFLGDPNLILLNNLNRFSTSGVNIGRRLSLRLERLIERYQIFFLTILCQTDLLTFNIFNIRVVICSQLLPFNDWIRLYIYTTIDLSAFTDIYGCMFFAFTLNECQLIRNLIILSTGARLSPVISLSPGVYRCQFMPSIPVSRFRSIS